MGELSIIEDLREHVNAVVTDKPVFFYNLALSVSKFKPPVSIFGNIVGNNASDAEVNIDIKKILMPVTSFSRLYTLHNNLSETNTLARIKQLYQHCILPKSMFEELVLSYNYLMQLRFRFQSKAILNRGGTKQYC